MENQHRKISGYRELSQGEIDLMNRIKSFGPQLERLVQDINNHIAGQSAEATGETLGDANVDECRRLSNAEPMRWSEIGRTDLQTGLMALTRAVAQPTFF